MPVVTHSYVHASAGIFMTASADTISVTVTYIPTITVSKQVQPAAASAAGNAYDAVALTTQLGDPGTLVILSPPLLPGVNYGQAYPGITLRARGGTAPYTWTATGLPSGFSLSTAGMLTGGTPSSGAGTYSFTVHLADSASHTLDQAHSITITNQSLATYIDTNTQLNWPGAYYGSNQTGSGAYGFMAEYIGDDFEGWAGPDNPSKVVQQLDTWIYDPGNWWHTTTLKGPQQSPATTGTIYTGPQMSQYFEIGVPAWGHNQPALSRFTSLSTSYSHVAPAPNGINWPNEGCQDYEFCYDIWLNGWSTEVMIWTYTEGPRVEWGQTCPSWLTPVGWNEPGLGYISHGGFLTLNCGPGGSPVNFAFGYNSDTTTATGQSYTVPRGPFNFIMCNSTGTGWGNTDQGWINLIGGGKGVLDWLVANHFLGGGSSSVIPGVPAYTPTIMTVNYGVEICSTGGTDYPPLTFKFTSFGINANPVWDGVGSPYP